MHILIPYDGVLPVDKYGGTQRVIWSLGKGLCELGHQVTYVCKFNNSTLQKSRSIGANVIEYDSEKRLVDQLPSGVDIIHTHGKEPSDIDIPYIVTIHGNAAKDVRLDLNSVFVSRNHAERYGSDSYVLNGLDWSEYPEPKLSGARDSLHFLGKAAWKVKNVRGAIKVAKNAKMQLEVMGGYRFNFKMGVRITLSPKVKFHGMVDNSSKAEIISNSQGLLFPVLWHEPFGLAIIESLYYGAPVFGTPYGSLPELIPSEYGHLSDNSEKLAQAIIDSTYDPILLHEYAITQFSHIRLAEDYLGKYKQILSGNNLHSEPPQLAQSILESPSNFPWA